MICQHLAPLSSKKIILASSSPRRQEILHLLGLRNLEIKKPAFEENLNPSKYASCAEYATETAYHKLIGVVKELAADGKESDLVISADTVVELEGEVLEKPADEEHAFTMLSRMSGKRHWVHTGVVLALPKVPGSGNGLPFIKKFSSSSEVDFDDLGDDTIRAYIATGEPMDKAGSYGIQGHGGAFVKKIDGCYFTVMGLPMHRLARELEVLIDNGSLPLSG